MLPYFLIINVGSSNIKLAVFSADNKLQLLKNDKIELDKIKSNFAEELIKKLKHEYGGEPVAIGHRMVHGGDYFYEPVLVNDQVITKLHSLVDFAPLHDPRSIELIRNFKIHFPSLKQIICFDTMFHQSIPRIARLFALPRKYIDQSVLRYGFHGLSYEYIASCLPNIVGDKALGKVIVAHLGSGASLSGMIGLKSQVTTMGLTTLDGLVMGTRCGTIDPGVILYLMKYEGLKLDEIEHMLYFDSGLKGVSAISSDIRVLEKSEQQEAKEAIDLFCYKAAREIGSITVALGGLDILIFTGGIGENSYKVRENIGDRVSTLGIEIDQGYNKLNKTHINSDKSRVKVLVLPTNEEIIIARYLLSMV
jgi:acetate kinase